MVSKRPTSERKNGKVTIHDVAAAAGVSKSTVSRVLDDRLPRSESDTAIRVRKIAAELGYVRDVSAASLRMGKTMTIGVIVPRLTDTVIAMLYESLARASAQRGHFAVVATTDDNPEAVRNAADRLLRRGVDGLILTTARNDDNFPDELERRGVPFVLALRTDGRHRSSIGDDQKGGYFATRHLIDLGHCRIGLIAGPDYASNARGRREGYLDALNEAGITPDPALILSSTFGIDSGAEAAERLMKLPDPPTAIFAINDNTAIGALSALDRLGLHVPQDVSLVGYNDIPIVRSLPTPLTTVHVPFVQIAAGAIDALLSENQVKQSIQKHLPTLIPRRSTSRIGG